MSVSLSLYVCLRVHVSMCMHGCVSMSVCVYLHYMCVFCMHACICVCMYVCMSSLHESLYSIQV